MRTCNAPEKQYRKYYEQWQKKITCKASFMQNPFFLFVPPILQNRFTTFLSFLLHIPLHSLQRDPWLVLLYLPCSSRAPHGTQLSTYNHLPAIIYYSYPFQMMNQTLPSWDLSLAFSTRLLKCLYCPISITDKKYNSGLVI